MSKEYYLQNYKKNPMNLRGQPDYCHKAKRRYKLHPDHYHALPNFKYLAYEQCLPGCVVKKNHTVSHAVEFGDELPKKNILLTNDTKCEAYDRVTPSV